MFSSSNSSNFLELIDVVEPKVSHDMNNMLTREFTGLEVKTALNQMYPLKSPSPDCMPPLFFQHYWNIDGDEVSVAVLNCLNTGSFPQSLNNTFITLIPMVKNPTRVSEFRPISLCNTLYKIVSKVVANRLKSLPNLILES